MKMTYPRKQPSPLLLPGIAALLLGMNGAIAEVTPGPTLCAALDLEVVILIEEHGAANDVAAERLAKAVLAQLNARAVCFKGHATEAIALYDEIIGSLGPTRVGSTR